MGPSHFQRRCESQFFHARGGLAGNVNWGHIRSNPIPLLMRWTRLLTVIAVAVAGCSTTDAAPPPGDYAPARFTDPDRVSKMQAAKPAIDSLFQTFAQQNRVPGIAFGVLIDGRLVHRCVAGVRDISTYAPFDSVSVFRIASMTKSFTSLSILKLRDD